MNKIHLTPDEVGLISWVTAYLVDAPDFETDNAEHPMAVLPGLHSRVALHEAGIALENNFNGPGFCWIENPADQVTQDILRICVEKSDYAARMEFDGHDHLALDSVDALRSLAYKLEELGIEIGHLPGKDTPIWSM